MSQHNVTNSSSVSRIKQLERHPIYPERINLIVSMEKQFSEMRDTLPRAYYKPYSSNQKLKIAMLLIKSFVKYPPLRYVIIFIIIISLVVPASPEEENHETHHHHTLFKHILISSTRVTLFRYEITRKKIIFLLHQNSSSI